MHADITTVASPPDREASGSFRTGAIRIRTGWLGFAIVEEQIEDISGSRYWQRLSIPRLLNTLNASDVIGIVEDHRRRHA